MSRKKPKQPLTPREIAYNENIAPIQDFQAPKDAKEKERQYTKTTHYLLMHKNFIKLSNLAKVVLFYMYDWAFIDNDDYLFNKKFKFSTTILENLGVASRKGVRSAFKELQHYGFIKKENNACPSGGFTQEWSFIIDWETGEKPNFKQPPKPP